MFPTETDSIHATISARNKTKNIMENWNQAGNWKIFIGNGMHSTKRCPLMVLERYVIGVYGQRIKFLEKEEKLEYLQDKYEFQNEDIIRMNEGQILMPGFIDAHTHACQYSFVGTSFGKPLMEWLENLTFPIESKFSDPVFASKVNRAVVKRMLKNGTTTAQYFGTIYKEAALDLCKVAREYGQRVFVGKSTMDFDNTKGDSHRRYMETTEGAANDTEKFIADVQGLQDPFAVPVVTPRFAVCNTSALMFKLGEIAKLYDVPIQSHISENLDEMRIINQRFGNIGTYTDVYRHHGLLNNKTVMAHGIYLSPKEMSTFKETGAGIVHCPSSNFNLVSGSCNVRQLLNNGIKVSLGTDVGGGHNISVMSQVREGYTNSVSLAYQQMQLDEFNKNTVQKINGSILSYFELYRLATLGGAEVLGIDKETGNFEIGKYFDAILVNLYCKDSVIEYFEEDDINMKVWKFLAQGDDRNVERVYVAGKLIRL